MIAGQLLDAGVPVFVADVKGGLSLLAQPIDAGDYKVAEPAASLDWKLEPRGHAVELLSLAGRWASHGGSRSAGAARSHSPSADAPARKGGHNRGEHP